jgi:hypothetical protein
VFVWTGLSSKNSATAIFFPVLLSLIFPELLCYRIFHRTRTAVLTLHQNEKQHKLKATAYTFISQTPRVHGIAEIKPLDRNFGTPALDEGSS